MGLAHDLIEESLLEVDDPNKPLTWLVRQISNADSTSIGTALLLNLGINDQVDGIDPVELVKRMGEDGVRKNWLWMEKVVSMGVAGLQQKDKPETREPLQIHMRKDHEDPDKGVVWVGTLKKQTVETLYKAIMALATKEGSEIERARTFRRESADVSDGAHVGEDLRGATEPDPRNGGVGDDDHPCVFPGGTAPNRPVHSIEPESTDDSGRAVRLAE